MTRLPQWPNTNVTNLLVNYVNAEITHLFQKVLFIKYRLVFFKKHTIVVF